MRELKKLGRKLEGSCKSAGRWIVKNDVLHELLSFLLVLGAVYLGVMGGLMVILTTGTPLRSVVSDSMKHYDNYTWRRAYEQIEFRRYAYENGSIPTENFPLQGGFERGDLLVIRGVDPKEIKIGDVIVYEDQAGRLIVHRVWDKRGAGENLTFVTKGDANPGTDPPIRAERVMGKVVASIPKLGWFSIWWRTG
ncbi:MAG: signal peptidase I [Candidatus Hadarchaeales archaeon]